MASGFKIQLASRLKKVAIDLYDFVENPNVCGDRAKYLTAVAHLIDVSATDVESEITQLRRTLGGLNAKVSDQANRINRLESDLALTKAQLDKARNDTSPAVRMATGYK